MQRMDGINNYQKYEQLLGKIIDHDFGDPQRKNVILKKLRNNLNKIINQS